MTDEVTLTIDGVEVKTEAGTNILQASMDAGMYIPYLCYYPGMKSFGACRMCVVNIEGGPGSPASCTTPVADGMVVNTKTPEIVDLRKGIMDLLISEHPHGCLNCHRVDLCGPTDICLRHVSVNDRCVTCPKNERCELKDTVRYMELDLDTPLTYNNRHIPQSVKDPMWEMDLNLCIVCGRCVRACDEIRSDNAITFTDRAGRSLIGTSNGTSLLESGCEFCGLCIDVCPTGALVEREHKWDKAVKTVTSTCPHCPVGCQMSLEIDKRNRLIRAVPDRNAAANHGQACFKGKFGLEFVNRRERLRKSFVRLNGSLEESPLGATLDVVAERLESFKGDQFALLASSRGSNEDNYIAQKFARVVMGTNNVDISSNLRPELVSTLGRMLGYHAGTNPIWELEQNECFLVVSSNVTEEHNVAAVPVKKAVRQGSSLIVVDTRETELTRYATIWIRPNPGTEAVLIGGMLRVIVDEALENHEFLNDRCDDEDLLRSSLWGFDLVKVSDVTGVSKDQIREAARLVAGKSSCATLYALETVQPELHKDCVEALVNLAVFTNNIGNPTGGLYPLYPGANEQGSKDVGCTPEYLPGYLQVSDDDARLSFQREWGVELSLKDGLGIKEMVEAINDGRVKALMVIGNSPNFTNGELEGFTEILNKLEFLVVQDTFPTELTEKADVVLPSSTFAESEGTYTNMERRVQLVRPALGPKGDEDSDWRIVSQIARRMGASGFDHPNAQSVFDEIGGLVKMYRGMSYERLESGGLQWPCSDSNIGDTPVLYAEKDDVDRVRLSAMTVPELPRHDDSDYPFLLARGRVLHDNSRPLEIDAEGKRNAILREEIFEFHPEDAQALGLSEGESVDVVSDRTRQSGLVRLSSFNKGVISTTALFGQMAVSLDQSEEFDPMLKFEGLPLVPVRVERLNGAMVDSKTLIRQ